jgi:hypothetical protein
MIRPGRVGGTQALIGEFEEGYSVDALPESLDRKECPGRSEFGILHQRMDVLSYFSGAQEG